MQKGPEAQFRDNLTIIIKTIFGLKIMMQQLVNSQITYEMS